MKAIYTSPGFSLPPVKCILKQGVVEVSGGGLEHVYSTLQFHFHWGSASQDSAGSEHTVDSHRYPMEVILAKHWITVVCPAKPNVFFPMCVIHDINCVLVQMHIVNKRKDLNLTEAVKTPNGLAVLAFLIEVTVVKQTFSVVSQSNQKNTKKNTHTHTQQHR